MASDHLHPHRPRLVRATALPERSTTRASRATMASLASDLLEALSPEQRRTAQWPFATDERANWHFVPRQRAGVPLQAMSAAAKAAVHDLLRHSLSEIGYQKATDIMALEEPLGLIENHQRHYRHPENYSVTVFGEPGRLPWGWRIEGHHLSLNFTAVSEELTAVAPVFFGANPAKVPDGYPMAGHRTLARETDLSFELIQSLDEAQRARAMIAASAPADFLTVPGREHFLTERQGLPLAAMPERLQNLALELIADFTHSLRHDLAETELDRIRDAGVGQIHFAWAGALEPGTPNYWRLHGPLSVIEYDNTQNQANHIHSVWHDLERNFGRDLLREHYETGHRHG